MSNPGDQIAALNAEFSETPYEFRRSIGQGGMGAVFEVEHRTLKRKLVIKILREPNRPDLEDRLRLEAQALAQLNHPNLLSVVDYAHTASGRPYLVSELLKGKTLGTLLSVRGRPSTADSVRYAMQALAGLSVAHRAGVVHRDVKLDNLYLCDGDEVTPPHVKVLDFGIAKLVGAEENRTAFPVAPLANPTAEGTAIGTPSFMSPEQVMDLQVDQRSDIYGMGAVLYRLLTGRNVFTCRDLFELASAHATDLPTPPSRFAELPPGLEPVVLRALEKNPAHRFQSAKEMIDALEPFAAAGGPRPSGPAPAPVPSQPAETTPETGVDRGLARLPEHTEVIPRAGTTSAPVQPAPAEALDESPAVTPAPRSRVVEIVALVVALASLAAILYFALVLTGALH
jgi:eukaryotic-like serine/threonine-protein kinase